MSLLYVDEFVIPTVHVLKKAANQNKALGVSTIGVCFKVWMFVCEGVVFSFLLVGRGTVFAEKHIWYSCWDASPLRGMSILGLRIFYCALRVCTDL